MAPHLGLYGAASNGFKSPRRGRILEVYLDERGFLTIMPTWRTSGDSLTVRQLAAASDRRRQRPPKHIGRIAGQQITYDQETERVTVLGRVSCVESGH